VYLEVTEGHVAGSAELQHATLDGSKLLDGESKGLDAVVELLTAPEDHDDYWCN